MLETLTEEKKDGWMCIRKDQHIKLLDRINSLTAENQILKDKLSQHEKK